MKSTLRRACVASILCVAIMSLAGCASPNIDGGIVGTGNRIDCERLEKERAQASLPEDCKQESGRK
jgi:hypothetical protein